MKRLWILALATMVLFTLSEGALAQFKATMKLGSAVPADHPYNVGGQKFADLIKERSNGRIAIKVYPAGQLGKGEREMVEGLQQGAIELVVSSTGPLGGFSPSVNILDFPMLFRDNDHVDLVLDGPLGRRLLDDFEKANIKGLAFWENGFRHLTNSRIPVNKADDAKGLKIRTMENKVHLAAWKAAGVNPTPMAWGEVFTALQQKVIDGQENPIAVIYSSKLWEAGQKHLSLTAHVYSPAILLMSKKVFDSMPKEDQELFHKTAVEVGKFQRKINREAEEQKIKDIEAKGVKVIRDVDRDSFRKAMSPVYDQFPSEFPRANIEAIMNAK